MPGSRSSHWTLLIRAASPVAWPLACHFRATSMTSFRCIPTRTNTAIPLSTMPARLAPNRKQGAAGEGPLPRPRSRTRPHPRGGPSATATATPGIEAESRFSRDAVTTAPASPEHTAMARSNVVGWGAARDLVGHRLEREHRRHDRRQRHDPRRAQDTTAAAVWTNKPSVADRERHRQAQERTQERGHQHRPDHHGRRVEHQAQGRDGPRQEQDGEERDVGVGRGVGRVAEERRALPRPQPELASGPSPRRARTRRRPFPPTRSGSSSRPGRSASGGRPVRRSEGRGTVGVRGGSEVRPSPGGGRAGGPDLEAGASRARPRRVPGARRLALEVERGLRSRRPAASSTPPRGRAVRLLDAGLRRLLGRLGRLLLGLDGLVDRLLELAVRVRAERARRQQERQHAPPRLDVGPASRPRGRPGRPIAVLTSIRCRPR